MFFKLEYIEDHPIYQMQEAIEAFFNHCATKKRYSRKCFPEWFRSVLHRSQVLEERFKKIARLIQACDEDIRQRILSVFQNNNQIQRLCEDKDFQVEFLDLEVNELKEQIKKLFDYLYDDVITRSNLFDDDKDHSIANHYVEFRESNENVCPFCGIEAYDPISSGRRTSYDHYLARTIYPFAAVNFENLVPMCDRCNVSPNKGSIDIIFTSNERHTRRQVFYPYANNAGVSLKVYRHVQTHPLSNIRGEWNVELIPHHAGDSEKLLTWNQVFKVNSRLAAQLQDNNIAWISHFLASSNLNDDISELRQAFRDQAQILTQFVRTQRDTVLKKAFFAYLADSAPEIEIEGYRQIVSTEYFSAFTASVEALENE